MLDVSVQRSAPQWHVEYRELAPHEPLGRDVLAAITFGESTHHRRDPRCIRVPLAPLVGSGLTQVWTSTGPVTLGQSGAMRYAEDGSHLMGWLEVDENAHGGLANAAEAAYQTMLEFHGTSHYRHVWRIWNFVGDINAGEGDEERYKQFSLGRARAFGGDSARTPGMRWPAATAVGTLDGRRRLQVCWLAGIEAGQPVENPRQVSAYCYPRQFGPAPPRFSRAMLAPTGALLVSGTASIVGHDSMHRDDLVAQLEETLRNIDAVAATAESHGLPRTPRAPLLTVFLRRPADAPWIARRLREHYSPDSRFVILDAAICRSELLLEIEAIG